MPAEGEITRFSEEGKPAAMEAQIIGEEPGRPGQEKATAQKNQARTSWLLRCMTHPVPGEINGKRRQRYPPTLRFVQRNPGSGQDKGDLLSVRAGRHITRMAVGKPSALE